MFWASLVLYLSYIPYIFPSIFNFIILVKRIERVEWLSFAFYSVCSAFLLCILFWLEWFFLTGSFVCFRVKWDKSGKKSERTNVRASTETEKSLPEKNDTYTHITVFFFHCDVVVDDVCKSEYDISYSKLNKFWTTLNGKRFFSLALHLNHLIYSNMHAISDVIFQQCNQFEMYFHFFVVCMHSKILWHDFTKKKGKNEEIIQF